MTRLIMPPSNKLIMPCDAWWIDLINFQPYEMGALLLALLAFPEWIGSNKFEAAHQALCARAIRDRSTGDPEFANSYGRFKPTHIALSESDQRASLKTFERRMRDRMLAGRLINLKLALLKDPGMNVPTRHGTPRTMPNTSLNALIDLTLEDLDELGWVDADLAAFPEADIPEPGEKRGNANNALTRIWRESSRVAHLAAAVQAYLAITPLDIRAAAIGDIIFKPEAIQWVTLLASKTETDLVKQGKELRLKFAAERLIFVHWGQKQENLDFMKATP
jgi:hypothetical protein